MFLLIRSIIQRGVHLDEWKLGYCNSNQYRYWYSKNPINGGNNLTKPTQAVNLVELVPYISSSGAMTAGESLAVTLEVDSFSVDLLPKRLLFLQSNLV